MGEFYEEKDRALPGKRKLDVSIEDQSIENERKESCKREEETVSNPSGSSKGVTVNKHCSPALKEEAPETSAADLPSSAGLRYFDLEQEELNDDEEEDSDYRDSDEEAGENEGKENGNSIVDKKGKGILIEVSNSSEDEEESDEGDEDEESEIEEDPLAEVDLDNILPTRTRKRGPSSRPGVFIDDRDDPSA